MDDREREAFDAIEAGDDDRLARLLQAHPAVAGARDGDGVSLLRRALYSRRGAAAERIAAAGPELDVHDAAAAGDVERLEELVDGDATLVGALAGDGFAPLHLAAFFSHAAAVRLLVDRGADPDCVAANGSDLRPLHSAAAAGDRESAECLLEAGADPNARQRGGYTPLDAAINSGDDALAGLLRRHGADPAAGQLGAN